MFQRIIWTAETMDLTEDPPEGMKKRLTEIIECKEYSRKLKIKEVGFEDLKVVNFKQCARVFLALVFVCSMALVIEFYFYTYTYKE